MDLRFYKTKLSISGISNIDLKFLSLISEPVKSIFFKVLLTRPCAKIFIGLISFQFKLPRIPPNTVFLPSVILIDSYFKGKSLRSFKYSS